MASDDHVAAALNAFAKELTQNSRADVYDYLEAERIKYAIRLPMNRVLQERIGYLRSKSTKAHRRRDRRVQVHGEASA